MKIKKSVSSNVDLETLKFWKYSSPESKLEWLQDAMKFARLTKKIVVKKSHAKH